MKTFGTILRVLAYIAWFPISAYCSIALLDGCAQHESNKYDRAFKNGYDRGFLEGKEESDKGWKQHIKNKEGTLDALVIANNELSELVEAWKKRSNHYEGRWKELLNKEK